MSVIIIGAHLTVLGIHTPTGSDSDNETSPMLFMMAVVSFAAAFVWWDSRANKACPPPATAPPRFQQAVSAYDQPEDFDHKTSEIEGEIE